MRAPRLLLALAMSSGLASLALPVAARPRAAPAAKPKTFLESCKADRERFCREVQLGHGRLLLCLKEHEPDLQPECLRFFLGDKEPTKL